MKVRVFPIFFVFFCLSISVIGKDIYQQVRVFYSDSSELHQISRIGIPLDHVRIKKGVFIDIVATQQQVDSLQSLGFRVDIIQDDLIKFFKRRFDPSRRFDRGFELGSMGGNYTFNEMIVKLDELHERYPSLVSEKQSIGQSHQGRDIWAVKISDNVAQEKNLEGDIEPLVLYTGLTHGREPLGMMNLIYFMVYLCENYNRDENVSYVVNNRELWFIPIVNPDGYVYNETIEPDGGGMHRKNRKDTGCGDGTDRGVDLNRNFSYDWGLDDEGSSPDPCSQVFRGASAFSEEETSILRDFMVSKTLGSSGNLRNVLHYHTYSNILIHSYGNGEYPPEPDLSKLRAYGAEMTKFNHYRVGTGPETVGYTVNGDAVDYSYGDLNLISYTPEVGTFDDYFWPPTDRIVPLCEENVWPNLYFARIAGPFIQIENVDISQDYVEPGDSIALSISFQNIGLQTSYGTVNTTVLPLNSIIDFKPINIKVGVLEPWEKVTIPLDIIAVIDSSAREGCLASLTVKMSDANKTSSMDTISFLIGRPSTILVDNAESGLNKWESTDWGLSTTSNSYEGNYSFTDSPIGFYLSEANSVLRLKEPLDLSEALHSTLRFWAKWDIEPVWDFVQVQASINEIYWTNLSGNFTTGGSGNGVQSRGKHGYDGTQPEWVQESMDLSAFDGESEVFFRFVLQSDESIQGDGFYFDNLEISTYSASEIFSGDITQDCVLDVNDILAIVDMILTPELTSELERRIADLNQDGKLNVFDVILLVDTILGRVKK